MTFCGNVYVCTFLISVAIKKVRTVINLYSGVFYRDSFQLCLYGSRLDRDNEPIQVPSCVTYSQLLAICLSVFEIKKEGGRGLTSLYWRPVSNDSTAERRTLGAQTKGVKQNIRFSLAVEVGVSVSVLADCNISRYA